VINPKKRKKKDLLKDLQKGEASEL